ncbi:hypothetical protein E2C01_100771 [Portunus trituberculatus]|uniref:Ankyrin repeat domain-containing protein n=2 Tax=Portunus trituberculatus TaxID=210409 RepID=A0A5B7KD21_PORTR|nr:hypothetical protein [Portunus trituberculatus]
MPHSAHSPVSTSSPQEVFAAVQRGDLEWLGEYREGQEVAWRDLRHGKSGDTILHTAAAAGGIEVVT